MQRHAGQYTLWILCVDDVVHHSLGKLDLPNVRLLQLSKLETPELLKIKSGRSTGEYCWTLTPFAPRFVFEADAEVSHVTYIDADLWFRKSPAPIFREFNLSKMGVLITDHAYASEHDQSVTSGQFCVQFMTFTRDGGEAVRKWWEERCIEWCYNRLEDGKFGDQKYLDDWPDRFPDSVHILSNRELLLAPWNATRFPYGNSVAWHFHSFRIASIFGQPTLAIHGSYLLPKCTRENVYKPYLKDLRVAVDRMKCASIPVRSQKGFTIFGFVKLRLVMLIQRIWLFNTGFVLRL
jgi:hypothetical protein